MYLAMDMGTTNTRIWLCNKNRIIDSKKAPFGAKLGKLDGKNILFERLRNVIYELLRSNEISESKIECIITSGMSGSEIGIREIPHIELPADIYKEAEQLCIATISEITDIPFWFVPGLKKISNGYLSDIIRGEETEVFGLLPYLPQNSPAIIVLPGTHNKIIRINERGEIVDFQTTLSGELLDMIITKSILSGSVFHDFEISESDVLQGAAFAETNGINAAIFHVRVMEKNGISSDSLSSFLYGAVIGNDAKLIRQYAIKDFVFIGGNSRLQSVYQILLKNISAASLSIESSMQAVISGLQKIHSLHSARTHCDIIKQAIEKEKLISIVRSPDQNTLKPAVQALYDGGVRLLEITFDRSGKLSRDEICSMISELSEKFDGRMLVGAGTVTSCEEVFLAFAAGALFIISPSCDHEIIKLTKKLGMVSIPAAYTATEITEALNNGADYIKLFPADQVTQGYVKAICAPLSDAKLLAVGGVTAENAGDFIDRGFHGVGVGSNLYNKKLIQSGDFESLRKLAAQFVKAVKT